MDKPTVFIVAADAHTWHIYSYVFDTNGFAVTVVNAEDVVQRASAEKPQLIVMEHEERDVQLCAVLRKATTSILVITSSERVRELLHAGATHVMERPVHYPVLIRDARELVNRAVSQ